MAERPDDELDPRLLWRWVGRATRPVAGWACIAVAGLFVLAGYLGVSREAIVAKQLPYLISGGVGGVVLAIVGAYLLGTEDLRRDAARLDRLERMVAELHSVLLTRPDAPPVGEPAARQVALVGARNGSGDHLYVLSDGEIFHRAGCSMIEGKTSARPVTRSTIRRRGLAPCPMCEPVLADA
jgi:hypothetical protein